MDNKQVTAEWIAQQRAVCDAATQGPWESKHYGRYEDHDECCIALTDDSIEPSKYENADFIAAARTALPAALDALEAAYAEISRLTAERDAAVRDWQQAAEGSGSFDSCGACTHRKYDNTDGIYCDIKVCHPEWRGPEPGGEGGE